VAVGCQSMADQQQLKIEQRNTVILMMAALTAQTALSWTQLPFVTLLLPAAALAVAIMVLTLRSEFMLRSLRRKRVLLATAVLGIAAFVTLLLLLVDEPRNSVLFPAAALLLIDFGFLTFGRLVGSMVGSGSSAHPKVG
jgi:hypothetical protein